MYDSPNPANIGPPPSESPLPPPPPMSDTPTCDDDGEGIYDVPRQ